MGKNASEILKLQDEITREVTGDAAAIAQGVFGENKNHPDMAQVSNEQLDGLYRSKYQANDRQWLQAEARRDPDQFLKVAQRIGVQAPQTGPGASTVVPQDAFAKAAMANASTAPQAAATPAMPMAAPVPAPMPGVPVALPAPPAAPVAPLAAAVPPPAPPVILGPNGLPLR